jgi:hypothetical protein
MRTIKILVKEAKQTFRDFLEKKKSGGKEERNSIQLEPVNERDLHRPASPGRVLEDDEIQDPKILHKRIQELRMQNAQLRKKNTDLEHEVNRLKKSLGNESQTS